jgi:hypothetical protein
MEVSAWECPSRTIVLGYDEIKRVIDSDEASSWAILVKINVDAREGREKLNRRGAVKKHVNHALEKLS